MENLKHIQYTIKLWIELILKANLATPDSEDYRSFGYWQASEVLRHHFFRALSNMGRNEPRIRYFK